MGFWLCQTVDGQLPPYSPPMYARDISKKTAPSETNSIHFLHLKNPFMYNALLYNNGVTLILNLLSNS